MNPRTGEIITITLVSLAIVSVVVGLILLIFMLSGHQDLLSQMLQNTAKGEVLSVAFTAGGPFGMWIITFILIRYTISGIPLVTMKIFLHFPKPQQAPPSKPSDFRNAKCWYSIFSDGTKVINDTEVTILADLVDRERNVYVPYIYVKDPGIENPEFQFKLEYGGQEWYSDSLSLKNRSVDLR